MHQLNGVPRRGLAVLCLLTTLCSCGRQTPEQRLSEVRSYYKEMKSLTAQAELTADYGERVYSYQVQIDGNAEAGKMTVLEPENITGTVLEWADGETELEYDGVSLETGPLTAGGLSPADCIPAILNACQEGELLSLSEEKDGTLTAELKNPLDGSVTVTCVLDAESLALRQAELSENGRRVMTAVLTEFSPSV